MSNTSTQKKYKTLAPEGSFTNFRNDRYYCIHNYDRMDPFFMTLSSPSDHWFFISSSGGLTAGRKDANSAIFPYYTVDKVTENGTNTGGISLFHVGCGEYSFFWKPFEDSLGPQPNIERNLYKNICGNSLVFQEILLDYQLSFEVEWTTSPHYGIIRRCCLNNRGRSELSITLLDGVRNTLPAMVTDQVQLGLSNLLDAYKRSELTPAGLGLYSLSATLTDKAEPSESLKSTTWWQKGLDHPTYLLSEKQLKGFSKTGHVVQEEDVKGSRGAYLVHSEIILKAKAGREWMFCGEVNQNLLKIEALLEKLQKKDDTLLRDVELDLEEASTKMRMILGKNDGLQSTGNELTSAHHFSNVMFNVMRGGYFAKGYSLGCGDLKAFVQSANHQVFERNRAFWIGMEGDHLLDSWEKKLESWGDIHLARLVHEYLPVTFSRRHGDPSRPWNRFSINTENRDGTPKIDFQGNWRDIFQNWEALLVSNPRFVFSVIAKFFNATTRDGYNPYRISRDGIDWERPEPDNPWAGIGYWSDHQIIYLLKLLELAEQYYPGKLSKKLLNRELVHANVPYEIRPYNDLKRDPRNSIEFNWERDKEVSILCEQIGSDGRLLHRDGEIVLSHMLEKMMILLLAKCSNFIPDGGIWMNTQRPEWNDANNALVGEGISVVTLSYLIRYTRFLVELLQGESEALSLSQGVTTWLESIRETLMVNKKNLDGGFTPLTRQKMVDRLGTAGESYRLCLYKGTLNEESQILERGSVIDFCRLVLSYFEKTLDSSFREDGLIHSYNRLEMNHEGLHIYHYYEMLEGQVAGICSKMFSGEKTLSILNSLRSSAIYREDQDSYMLYPNRDLKGYMQKNSCGPKRLMAYPRIVDFLSLGKNSLLEKSLSGSVHFNSSFRNKSSLNRAIEVYESEVTPLAENLKEDLMVLFEEVFQHRNFTGRSGTFFGFEGLGSIYWHMVSKLLLATQDALFTCLDRGDTSQIPLLREKYYHIRWGIGFNKTPSLYGAFPTDPYSHTPHGKGAKQPGMTGQVKEEVISRFAELGLRVRKGQVLFTPTLLLESEFLVKETPWALYNQRGEWETIILESQSFGFTFCQVPVIVRQGEEGVIIHYRGGTSKRSVYLECSREDSLSLFNREGLIDLIEVSYCSQEIHKEYNQG